MEDERSRCTSKGGGVRYIGCDDTCMLGNSMAKVSEKP